MKEIPIPAIQRMSVLFHILKELKGSAKSKISSSELGALSGTAAHTIRKDISCLGVSGNSGSGYDVQKLMDLIGNAFGFFSRKKACIVGLGKLGSALLQHPHFSQSEFEIVAGFDSNVNRIETIPSSVPLFPAYQLIETVSRMSIEYGLCAVPPGAAQETAEKLVSGGVKGIINFAPVIIQLKNSDVIIRNIDITGELRILAAQVAIRTDSSKQ